VFDRFAGLEGLEPVPVATARLTFDGDDPGELEAVDRPAYVAAIDAEHLRQVGDPGVTLPGGGVVMVGEAEQHQRVTGGHGRNVRPCELEGVNAHAPGSGR
jgi:hypothetical protein